MSLSRTLLSSTCGNLILFTAWFSDILRGGGHRWVYSTSISFQLIISMSLHRIFLVGCVVGMLIECRWNIYMHYEVVHIQDIKARWWWAWSIGNRRRLRDLGTYTIYLSIDVTFIDSYSAYFHSLCNDSTGWHNYLYVSICNDSIYHIGIIYKSCMFRHLGNVWVFLF